jgi:DNA-directed RNA polymerase alpha subunit
MGRKRKLKLKPEDRKKINYENKYWENQGGRVVNTFDRKTSKKLKQAEIHTNSDLQDFCKKEPEKLLTISTFGPMKVKEICKEVGVQLETDELNRLYRKIKK